MGVYMGEHTVIHFNGEKKKTRDGVVRKETLEQFAAGFTVKLHASPKNTDHAKAVCDAAERLFRNSTNEYNNQYHFAFNNCEDFCVACYEVRYA